MHSVSSPIASISAVKWRSSASIFTCASSSWMRLSASFRCVVRLATSAVFARFRRFSCTFFSTCDIKPITTFTHVEVVWPGTISRMRAA